LDPHDHTPYVDYVSNVSDEESSLARASRWPNRSTEAAELLRHTTLTCAYDIDKSIARRDTASCRVTEDRKSNSES
jgi:hypothetical protein